MLELMQLERRDCPASAVLNGGVLTVLGDVNQSNVITVDTVASQVRLTLNGDQTFYNSVNQLVLVGGDKVDDITNNTNVPGVTYGGAGGDTVMGGTGNDVTVAGAGKDIVYDLLGVNTVISNDDNVKDTVFVNFNSTVTSGKQDQVVTFFAPGRTPGSGSVTLEKGVLYLAPNNNGNQFVLNQVGNKVVLNYNLNNGTGLQTVVYNKKDIKFIAFFGGTGNDVYINNTNISEASYGSAGRDLIFGGFGGLNLLKGSGDSDVLVGRGKKNDLSSNGGNDVLGALFGQTTFRTRDGDVFVSFNQKDLVVKS